VNFVSQTAEIL